MTDIWITIGFGLAMLGFAIVGAALPALLRARRADHDQLRCWARQDGLPDVDVKQLRAFYRAQYPDMRW